MSTSEDEEAFQRYSQELADAIDREIEGWVTRSVKERCAAAGVSLTPDQLESLEVAASRCRADVTGQVHDLLTADIDDQRTTPLAIIRSTVHYGAAVLSGAGVEPVQRDEFERRSFPDDYYGLTPAAMSDVAESLAEPALVWGAAKAHIHRTRHR